VICLPVRWGKGSYVAATASAECGTPRPPRLRDTGQSLSQENVDLVREAYANPFGGEVWLALVDKFVAADCVIEDRTLPDVAVGLRGPGAARAEAAHMLDVFEDVDYAIEELRELDDRVLVRVHGSAQGRGSGLRIVGTLGHLWTLRARKVVRFDVYGTWQEALDAVGLRE